jgi:dTDP-4-dehydrorhamnose reductase
MSMRILLTGKTGQVGSELARLFSLAGELTALGRNELDLAKPDEVRHAIAQSRPNLIINAAAYTAVDQAEKEELLARIINADGPAVLAEEAKKIGAFLIHYSTDYVFDGTKRSPYAEDDATDPPSVYGRTKLAGEEAIRASGVLHLILRTAWVYATSGRNFLLTILRLASSREELRIVNDQFGTPTWARSIAEATARIVGAIGPDMDVEGAGDTPGSDRHTRVRAADRRRSSADYLAALRERSGTYHLTAAGVTTWYEFALAILESIRDFPPGVPWITAATGGRPLMVKRIIPITTQEYPTPARRPLYSVLSNARFAQTFGFALRDWRRELSRSVLS